MRSFRAALRTPIEGNRFRRLGILPLVFFLARVIEYAVVAKTPEQILWCCHISNLLLAIGMFLANPFLIRVAVFWLILGLPPWAMDMVMTGLVTPVSLLSHGGGFVLAILAIRHVGAKPRSWLPSLLYFLILQQVTRLVTAPTPYTNVNVAHFAYGPWKDLFAKYWTYWAVNTALTTLGLIVIERALLRWFPGPER